ncbi:Nephrocystin-3 [Termitomyces sp. J132]|nr:Nephrocystin-3 [Termitomyces sp. J132]
MPIDLAIEKYVEFSKKVYSDIKTFSMGSERFKASTFVSAMEDMLQSAGFPADVLMQEENPFCKSFVAALPYANMTPRIFRSYSVKANQGYNCTVVEAARATTASPQFFKAVSIGAGGLNEKFIGAHLGHNNPINFVLEEAELVFGASQSVACIVSIGAGHPGNISWKSSKLFPSVLMKVLMDISTSCEASVESCGLQKVALDDWNSLGEIKTHSVNYLHKAEITQKVDLIVDTLHNSLQKITLAGLLLPGSFMKEISMHKLLPVVPAPSFLFTGRADVLYQLEKYFINESSSLKFNHQKHFVLYGLGGAGKTQIALQFSHTFKNSFSLIYMIDASSQESIQQFLVQIAHNAQLPEATPATVLVWLCYQTTEWLIIFDNADDPDLDLWKFFPMCSHGNIIITSRNRACIKYAPENFYQVGEMLDEDSLSVLLKASLRCNLSEAEHAAAKELVQELGNLALAIVQAGGYLHYHQHVKFNQYLENYKKDKPKYLRQVKTHNLDGYSLSAFATWDCSYQKLDRKAKEILMLCSVLHCSKIPVEILEKAWNNLTQYPELDTQEIKQTLELFVEDGNWDNVSLEKALDALQSYSLVEISGEGVPLLNIHSLVHVWSYKSLEPEKQKRAQLCAQQLLLCVTMKNLALTLRRVGKLEEAEKFEKQVLKAWTEAFGSSHPDTIRAMENLAKTLRKAGKLEEAEKFQQQVLKAWTEGFSRTEKFEQQVLKAQTEGFGSSHPDTIRAMENLALTLKRAGRLEEAEMFQQQVLKAQTEGFGSSHPDTIRAMENLAWILRTAGRLEEAEKFQQQVLNARTEGFGSHHPHTIKAMENLALTLRRAGRLEEAENFQLQVLKAWTEEFGSSHPDTIRAMENLALTLGRAGRLEEAEKFQQQVLKARTEGFSSSHPDTIRAIENLASILRRAGRLEEAEKFEQQVLKAQAEGFGSSHPDTIRAMENLAWILRTAGRLEEAEKFQQQVLNARTEGFGSHHPHTIKAMENLALTLRRAGRLEEAENFQLQVLKAWTEEFGSSHPDTIRAMENLALTLGRAGRLEEAEKFQQQALKAWKEGFSSSHPDTIRAMENLAWTLRRAGKLEEAKKLQQALKFQTQRFGSRHPDIIRAIGNLARTLLFKVCKLSYSLSKSLNSFQVPPPTIQE